MKFYYKYIFMCSAILLIKLDSIYSQSISASVSKVPGNAKDALDATIAVTHDIGDKDANLIGGGFVQSNTDGGPITRGLFAAANKNSHSLGIEHKTVDNFGKSLTGTARLNLLQEGNHKLDAIASQTRTHLDNGFKFTRNTAGLDYNHAAGHGLSLSGSHIPQVDMKTLDISGRANLWKSPDRATNLDLIGSGTKHFSGPFNGQFEKRIGFILNSRF